ncbi:hypothetical protein CK228_13400 [Mesorhizobium sp. WSM4312]|uniref:ImmA/IrrE family metallo-endopeptidase n=1 Tax=Mesorhizobium sp. WSM4312 TaxID=2029411 RepID=UPI000BB0AD6A|nr:ImmA/IrrE family metallo-endopeptidase [Mesorhizobium sp. WSM4312]PBB68105.1 hypothetical protein CK228_13400 [Mesorhizobium sp. WSM4312]
MATDIFVREGLTQPQMAKVASKYRHEFDLAHSEFVNIVEVLEFKLPLIYPRFRLVVRDKEKLNDEAVTETKNDRILVREDIYDGACEGDAYCRFVLAHELGHFLLHRETMKDLHTVSSGEYSENIKNLNAIESAEDQATIFARHFLVHPAIAFRYKEDIDILCRKTGVPRDEAATAITISKRQEMFKIRSGETTSKGC